MHGMCWEVVAREMSCSLKSILNKGNEVELCMN